MQAEANLVRLALIVVLQKRCRNLEPVKGPARPAFPPLDAGGRLIFRGKPLYHKMFWVLCALMHFQVSQTEGPKANMAKRRGNPNWGKPEPIGPVVPTVTSFEQVVKEFKLTPDQYIRSTRLREWARRNKNSKYIPEALLEAWGFEIESTL